jgi:uncharacterized protein
LPSPCLDCGACCATFRVSFYWAETDDAPGGQVPAALTGKVDAHRRCMSGTNTPTPRCVALQGRIGEAVSCGIYEQRPSPCRDFQPFDADGEPEPRCSAARARWNLPPLARQPSPPSATIAVDAPAPLPALE